MENKTKELNVVGVTESEVKEFINLYREKIKHLNSVVISLVKERDENRKNIDLYLLLFKEVDRAFDDMSECRLMSKDVKSISDIIEAIKEANNG
jgi:uncharacterized coiled-coil DUF342 family protein